MRKFFNLQDNLLIFTDEYCIHFLGLVNQVLTEIKRRWQCIQVHGKFDVEEEEEE